MMAQRGSPAKKQAILQEWLQLALQMYDSQETPELKRSLFERSMRSAAQRFTADELSQSSRNMEEQLRLRVR